jgi:hypothetical protein
VNARRLKLGALSLLCALALVELVYLLAGNLFLHARLARLAAQNKLSFESRGLRTLFPGDLRCQRVSLHDAAGRSAVLLRDMRAKLELLPLLRGVVRVRQLEARQLEARFDGQGPDAVHLTGGSQLHAASFVITRDRFSAQGKLLFTGARLKRNDLLVATFRGELTFDLPASSRPVPWRERVSVQSRLSAELSDIGPALRLPRAVLDAPQGRLETRVSVKQGRLVSCSLELEIGPAFGRIQELEWSAPRTVHVGLTVTDGHERKVRIRLSSASLHLSRERSSAHPAASCDAAIDLDLVAAPVGAQQASLAELHGLLRARSLRATAPGESHAAGAELEIERASWSRSDGLQLTGKLHATGQDAGTLLPLLDVEPALSWSLSELQGQRFRLDFSVDSRRSRVSLQDIALETPALAAQGGLQFVGGGLAHGALLVQRGRLRFGLLLGDESSELDLKPGPDWLAQALGPE